MIYTVENTSRRFICGFFSSENKVNKYLESITKESNFEVADYQIKERTGNFDFFGKFDSSILLLEKQYHQNLKILKQQSNSMGLKQINDQLRTTIDTLKLCDDNYINLESIEKVIRIPNLKHDNLSYKIIIDDANTSSQEWKELKLKKHPDFKLSPYDLIVKKYDV